MVVLIEQPRFIYNPKETRSNQKEDYLFLYKRIKDAAIPLIRRIGSDAYASAKTSLKTSVVISPLFLRVAAIVQPGSLAAVGGAVLTAFVAYNIALTVILFSFKIKEFFLQNVRSKTVEHYPKFSNQINPSHIKVEKDDFDFSQIPQHIQIEQLLTFLNSSDFSEAEKKNMRNGIDLIIMNINNKIPFLGTPPAGTDALNVFYNNLKNMLRFCVYELIEEEREFLQARGGVAPAEGSEDFNKYRTILDAKKRVLTQMSDVSIKCGSRWMGEALILYSMQKPKASQSFDKSILNHLSLVRRDILNHLIQSENNNDTHFYAAVMQSVGQVIGVPGSDLAVEHLREVQPFQMSRLIEKFNLLYSSEKIVDEIKACFKSNQQFREQTYDWIQEQKADWKQEEYQERADKLIDNIRKIASEKVKQKGLKKEHIELLFAFIEELKKEPGFLKENYLSRDSIKGLFEQFLETNLFKPYFNENLKKDAPFFEGKNVLGGQPQVLRNIFQNLIEDEDKNSKGALLAAIKDVFNGKRNSFCAEVSQDDIQLRNIQRLLQNNQLGDVVIHSLQEISKPAFREKIERGFERERQREFLSEIVKEDGSLSDLAWKWILIENNILTPKCL